MLKTAQFLCTVAALGGCLGTSNSSSDGDADTDADTDTDTDADTDTGSDTGSDTTPVDTDGDGFFDDEEAKCGSDAADVESTCYRCGWRRGDPGDLVATGNAEGDTIENVELVDQCGDTVPLWDFAGEYHVLFLTAAW